MKVLSSGVSVTGGLLLAALVACSCSSKNDDAEASSQPGGSPSTGGSSATSAGSSGKATTAGSASGGASPSNAGTSSGNAGRGGSGGTTTSGAGGNSAGAGNGGVPGSSDAPCEDPGLVWKSANKTNYESYPDPGSQECVEFNGCTWEGQFAACDGKKPESWVMAHDIVAAFPDFQTLELHDLCLRKGDKTIVVTVLDTCGDSDCDGCCTENRGNAEQLIDVEKYTNQRWGVADGRIQWADLGPTRGDGCD
jgi:hypothetical protein